MNKDYYEQIATDLCVLHKVVKVEEALPRDVWSVGGELFYDYIDALVWAINSLSKMPLKYTECDNCRLRLVDNKHNSKTCKHCHGD